MKVKEVDRTANVAWSPTSHYPIYLAMGTAAQQLDATFSTKSALEIYELNFQEPGLDMLCKGSLATDSRFHKLAWGGLGLNRDTTSGVVVAGCDDGNIFVYDPNKIISGDGDALIFQRDKHTGQVRALDFNPFQTNLLASGASDSEIFIWDLNNPNVPMTPGAKSQPADDVTCIAWNCQVQHILASTFATRCVVWDLRKNEPIIKVSGSTSRMRCNVVTWHPEVATQMCLASEDDQTPFIQLWDLRFATSPLKTMESHQRGVLSLAWCPRDSDLLLSCGKDSRILCWNPNSNEIGGEVVCEIPTSNQWCFDVAWCPRNPGLISSCSFDGHVSVYSLMGAQQQMQPSSKVAEAFMGAAQIFQPTNLNVPAPAAEQTVMLRKPPKWLRRPVGGSFGFGGKLVTFELSPPASNNPQAPFQSPVVRVSQVVTEPQLVNRANLLEDVLRVGNYAEFCELKIANSSSKPSQEVWSFLRANFDGNPKAALMSLLGHDSLDVGAIKQEENGESLKNDDLTSPESAAFDAIAKSESTNWSLDAPFVIPNDQDTEGSVARLLLSGKLDAAVDLCIQSNLIVDAVLLGIVGGNGLLAKAQQAYFRKNANSSLTRLVSAIVLGHWSQLMSTCSLDSWKEALAGALTYADRDEFSSLCETLGRRLEQEAAEGSDLHAAICYICAGNVPKLVECWSKLTSDSNFPNTLQELVEQVTILRQAMALSNKPGSPNGNPVLASKLHHYSGCLAAQGKLSTALLHLQSLSDEEADVLTLRQRLNGALGIGAQPTASTATNGYRRDSAKGILKPAANVPQQPLQNKQQPQVFNPVQQPYSIHQRSSRSASWSDEVFAQPLVPAPTSAVPPVVSTAARGSLSHKYPAYIPDASLQPAYNTVYSQPSLDPSGFPQPLGGGHQPAGYPSYAEPPQPYFQPQYPHPADANVAAATSVPSTYPGYQANSKSGWNDPPPPLDQPQNKIKQEYEAPAPITHPLFGGMPEQPPAEMNYYASPNPPMYPAPNEPHGHRQDAPYQHVQQQAFEPPPPSPNAVPPKPPKLIPAEHQILNDVFEELKNKCSAQNNNMQVKRKLEDVSRKLEVLYEKLRENELSQNTLLGLHQIVQVAQLGDYASALNVHSQIVATGAFSEISGFMPGLKVLLQTSYQLAVRM